MATDLREVRPSSRPPRGVMRSSARRSVAASTWLQCPTHVVSAANAQLQHRGQRNLRVPAGPHVRQSDRQDCLALQQPSTKPRSDSTPSTGSTPSAGHRMGGSCQPVAPAAHHVHADVRCSLRTSAPQKLRLSLSVFSVAVAACKICTLPAKACLTAPHGPARRCPSACCRTAAVLRVPALPSAASKTSCARLRVRQRRGGPSARRACHH